MPVMPGMATLCVMSAESSSWATVRLRAQLLRQVQVVAAADRRSAASWVAVQVERALKAAGGDGR